MGRTAPWLGFAEHLDRKRTSRFPVQKRRNGYFASICSALCFDYITYTARLSLLGSTSGVHPVIVFLSFRAARGMAPVQGLIAQTICFSLLSYFIQFQSVDKVALNVDLLASYAMQSLVITIPVFFHRVLQGSLPSSVASLVFPSASVAYVWLSAVLTGIHPAFSRCPVVIVLTLVTCTRP